MKPIHEYYGRLGNQMFQMAYIMAQQQSGAIPDVYLQDPKYFESAATLIKKEFGCGIRYQPYVSVHVRRGDYLQDKAFVNLSETDYYDRAMAMFPSADFLIFSDDPSWCEANWRGPRYTVVQ